MFENIMNNFIDINLFVVGIVFLFSISILLTKYLRYHKVIKELDIFEDVIDKIQNDDRLLIFIIDTFKCTSCMNIFSEIKKTMVDLKINFISIDSRSKQNFVIHSQVPAILQIEKGEIIKKYIPSPNRPKNDIVQYQDFIEGVAMEWKKH
ncbi:MULTISPECIES: hypothetical protein [Lysinibacillus]|uniref:hypothetical protein n=1 Tax=Lysinibacillus TaxID=400634 RepID=UPI00257AF3A5|nr:MULTISPECIES: hypothetical protein [Lysinibacillus]